MLPYEYQVLNCLMSTSAIDMKDIESRHGKQAVQGCLSKGWAKKFQDYDKYWTDDLYLSITSSGILEYNIFKKSNKL